MLLYERGNRVLYSTKTNLMARNVTLPAYAAAHHRVYYCKD